MLKSISKAVVGVAFILSFAMGESSFSQTQTQAQTQTPATSPSPAPAQDKLNRDKAFAPDDLAPRLAACMTCHGAQGRATNQGYFPRIAGKPAGYLYNQLVNFRDGRREYAAMTYLLAHMDDKYLHEIAQYFADLDVAYPPPQTLDAPAAVLERGRQLVMNGDPGRNVPACVSCHGAAMTGVAPSIPGLLGVPRDYINAQLGGWKTGNRKAQAPDCMAKIASLLSVDDIYAASTWISAQAVPANAKAASTLPGVLPVACGTVQ